MSLRRALTLLALALLPAPMVSLAVVRGVPSLDIVIMGNQLHFWSVGATAVAAAIACAITIAAAPTLRETRLLFLALAFLAIAGLFSVHGLMTPGVIAHRFHDSVAVSSWASVAAGAVLVALSAARLPQRAERFVERAGFMLLAWTAVGVAAFILMSFALRDWLAWVPTNRVPVQYALTIVTTALFAFAAHRYWQAYRFARLPSQGAVVGALILLLQVPAILLWGKPWYLSWWIYHAVYGAAFAVLFAGWGIEVRRAGSLRAIADALSMRDALAQLNRGLDAHIVSLVDAIEAKDVATLGHVHRVGAHALAIGRRLGLSPDELRALVLAAQMHDVGKIGVPAAILAKRSRLTEAEFAEVRTHAARGDEIARGVPALRSIATVVRAHHERLDGSGYPDGLCGDAIPLPARIIAVADTYDAMTSARPYREPVPHDAAVAELRRLSGVQLDARCVDALLAEFDLERRPAA